MRIQISDCVECHDGNIYDLSHVVKGHIVGVNRHGSQRLFTRDGKYAGADRKKNISKILD